MAQLELLIRRGEGEALADEGEFFEIAPEKALEIFYRVQEVLPDCEIFDDYKREKPYEKDDKEDRAESKAKGMTDREKAIFAFWTAFNEYAKKRDDFVKEFTLRKAGKWSYYDLAIRRPSYHVCMRVTTRIGNILTGLYFSGDKKNYDAYLSIHDEVEKFALHLFLYVLLLRLLLIRSTVCRGSRIR